MEVDEIVETSDVEELEEELRLRRASSVPLGEEKRTTSPFLEKINSSPPRKRLKVCCFLFQTCTERTLLQGFPRGLTVTSYWAFKPTFRFTC